MKFPTKSAPFSFGPWRKGINNVKPLTQLGMDELAESKDFVFDQQGFAKTRPSLEKMVDGTAMSGFLPVTGDSALVFDNGELLRVWPASGQKEVLASGYSVGRHVSWARAPTAASVFFTNGAEYGVVSLQDWTVQEGFGTQNPDYLTMTPVSAGFGSMPAGTYLVGMTAVGELGESGCSQLVPITLAEQGGIAVSWTGTVPTGVSTFRVYASGPNGTRDEVELFEEVESSETSLVVDSLSRGRPLETLFLEQVPVPSLICFYNGRLFFAEGEGVFHTPPGRYGLFNRDNHELGVFPERVTVLEPGSDGLFVVADVTYSYVGKNPETWVMDDAAFPHGAVFGTGTQVTGSLLSFLDRRLPRSVPFWFSTRGAVIGEPGGTVYPIMKGRAEPEQFASGFSGVLEHDGAQAVLTALKDKKGPADGVALQESFSVHVIKHGNV